MSSKFCPKCHFNMSMHYQNGKCPNIWSAPIVREPVPMVVEVTEDVARKALPIFDGVIMYFPDAVAAVSEVSVAGNEQHNPGEPLHWARGKSMDQFNTALRHMIDHKRGRVFDVEKSGKRTRHLAKAAWRVLAALQLSIEEDNGEHPGRQDQADHRQVAERLQRVLPEARAERPGKPRARLPRKSSRARVRHRGKGTR